MSGHQPLKVLSYDAAKNQITILDQTLLPNEVSYKNLKTLEDIFNAIQRLEVRGAPAIGLTAAWGLAMHAQSISTTDFLYFLGQLKAAQDYLLTSRPTAVDLRNTLNFMIDTAQNNAQLSTASIQDLLIREAGHLQETIEAACSAIGANGSRLMGDNEKVLTYCNAGSLATGTSYGTALAPIYKAYEDGKQVEVYAAETRPLLQGGRLTAFELTEAGIPTTVIADNMIATVMAQGGIDRIFVGCDRMATNGDFANKIGTLNVAILADYYNIPFHVCLPKTTLDLSLATGDDIPIECRKPEEMSKYWFEKNMITSKARIYNPAFDITPHNLITSVIMEDGVFQAPYDFSHV